MTDNSRQDEMLMLKSWHLKMLIASGIAFPAISATGAYYSLQTRIAEVNSKVSEKVSTIQLDTSKDYVTKDDFRALQQDMNMMHDDVLEIKVLLHKKFR